MPGEGEHQGDEQRRFSRRLFVLGLAQVAGFGALVSRLYQLQVLDGSRYAPLATDNRTSLRIMAPVRGRIFDRNGLLLADNAESFRVSVTPSLTPDIKKTLDMLGRIVPLSAETLEQFIAKARRAGRGASITVASDITFEQVAQINLLAPQLPGVEAEIAYSRRYHKAASTAHITGYVGGIARRGIDDENALRLPGMKIGKSGIEGGMDHILRGVAGTRRSEVDVTGHVVRHLEEVRSRPGQDVFATIDTRLQSHVTERLSRERRAAVAVMDAGSGDILALVSVPTFDANDVVNPASAESWRRLREAPDHPMFNRAISGLYPPGSTFKLVTALAALEAGTIGPHERIKCPGSFTVGDKTYRCWKRHGHRQVNLYKAIKESCDVYFYEAAKRTGMAKIAAMARRLGLGDSKTEGILQEKDGVVPDSDWKRWNLREGWSLGDTIISAVGQGFVLASPLQLAIMTARIATGRQIMARLATAGPHQGAPDFAPLGIGSASLDEVRRAMVGVVNEGGGTGTAAQPSAPVLVAGKTGTSQVRRAPADENDSKDAAWQDRDHALFVAYFPAGAPRYSISAVIEHGGAGGAAAGPLVRDIIEYLIAEDPLKRPAAENELPPLRFQTGPGLALDKEG